MSLWSPFLSILGALAFFSIPAVVHADTFQAGRSTYRIVDGDTVAKGRNRMRIRGIDAPEIRNSRCGNVEFPKGRAARAALVQATRPPNRVTLRRYRKQRDTWGREVVDLYSNGRSVARLLVAQGHAQPWQPGQPRINWCETGFQPSGN